MDTLSNYGLQISDIAIVERRGRLLFRLQFSHNHENYYLPCITEEILQNQEAQEDFLANLRPEDQATDR